jgi:hypothetical protein
MGQAKSFFLFFFFFLSPHNILSKLITFVHTASDEWYGVNYESLGPSTAMDMIL